MVQESHYNHTVGTDGVRKAVRLAGGRMMMVKMTTSRIALKVDCKLRSGKLYSQPGGRKVKSKGEFTAFSADYHVPKSHQPRNN